MMKAIVVHAPESKADLPRLLWQDVPDVTYAPDEVLVQVRATAVNHADLLQAQGKYPPPPGVSEILGLEMAGVIAAVGAEVTDWQVGDRVCALLPGGGYAEQVAVPAGMLIRMPDNWSFAQATAVPEVWLTAYVNLFNEGALQPNETILIHAGASGVGTAAIQLARAIGATPLVTVGSDSKAERCVALGAALAVNYRAQAEGWYTAVMDFTHGRGVNLILDPVGANYFTPNLSALAPHGRLVLIGLLSGGHISQANLAPILRKRLRLIGSTLRNRPLAEKIALTQAFTSQFMPLFQTGQLQPIIDTIFPITQAAQAHAYLHQAQNVGKLILTFEDV
jgi:tumor protein p53-inducible protein 3